MSFNKSVCHFDNDGIGSIGEYLCMGVPNRSLQGLVNVLNIFFAGLARLNNASMATIILQSSSVVKTPLGEFSRSNSMPGDDGLFMTDSTTM